jgi:hypothetical protein
MRMLYKYWPTRLEAIILLLLLTAVARAYVPADTLHQPKPKKERTIRLVGSVFDSFTHVGLGARITLMKPDSTVVDTCTIKHWARGSFFFNVPAHDATYIVRASREGYEAATMNYTVKHIVRNTFFEMPPLFLKKKSKENTDKTINLDGVTVTATKIKMVFRGDTIIYNADAFNVPEGSMLDGLIKQLPGAKLNEDGSIYINGKKVDYLTLNGKNFFKGQNKMMLDNLPYYTVKNLRVYNKTTERSEWMGREVEKKDYVMDVQLKREYSRGVMGNVNVGAATNNRYNLGSMTSYFSDHTRVTLIGSANQSGRSKPYRSSNDPDLSSDNLSKDKSLSLQANFEGRDNDMHDDMSARMNWNSNNSGNITSSETFSTGGNIFSRNMSVGKGHNCNFSLGNTFYMKKPLHVSSSLQLSYNNNHQENRSRSATFNANPTGYDNVIAILDSVYSAFRSQTLMETVINRNTSASLSRSRSLSGYLSVNVMHVLPWGDNVELELYTNASREKPSDSFSRDQTDYIKNDSTDYRHRYIDRHSQRYNYHVGSVYTFNFLSGLSILARLSYEQDNNNSLNANYRLDRLGAQWESSPTHGLTYLPSTRDSLQLAMDAQNSNHYNMFTRRYRASASLLYRLRGKGFMSIELPLVRTSERLNYHNNICDTVARRSYTTLMPAVTFYYYGDSLDYSVSYRTSRTTTSLLSLMPNDNTQDALSRQINNPHLKNTDTHSFSANFGRSWPSRQINYRVGASASFTRNAIGSHRSYDAATGAYTYMQDNVNGNWQAGCSFNFGMPLDKKRHLLMNTETRLNYERSVDFDVTYTKDFTQLLRKVNNYNSSQRLQLSYTLKQFTCELNGNVDWRRSLSHSVNFNTINAWEYNYGCTVNWMLPWKLRLATDATMFCRRGYQEASMNTNNMIWNAQLGRSILKGKLSITLKVNDILNQTSNTYRYMNSQGITENWNNSVSRYGLLQIFYRFNTMKKGNAGHVF